MIGYLKGDVLENQDGHLILSVAAAPASAVGYAVTIPQSPTYLDFLPGKSAELFIYTHVREDSLDLYGFASRSEKELFLTLLTVNGIGPKGAMGILSKVDLGTLVQAILDGDKDSLVKIPGIGKKTAERVVVELADLVRKKVEAGSFATAKFQSGRHTSLGEIASSGARLGSAQAALRDAKEALVSLGYRDQEVSQLLKKVIDDRKGAPQKVEDLVRTALQQLAREA